MIVPMLVHLSYTEWEHSFVPICNKHGNAKLHYMPDDAVLAAPDNKVWTLLESEGRLCLSNGYTENELGYYLTEISYEKDVAYEVELS